MIRQFTFAFAMILAAVASATAVEYKFVSPFAFDRKVDVQVKGKTREYYALEGDKQVQVKVKGPTRLRVLSRVVLESNQDSADYKYFARREGGQKQITIRHHSRQFDNAAIPGETERDMTAIRARIIDVPRGEQSYSFFLPRDSKQTVLLRFERENNEFAQGSKVIAMTPISYTSRVDLVTKEETAAYYRVGSTDKVGLRLIGPATVKAMSRIEFSQTMNGAQNWRVQVIEDGKVKATHSLSARQSQVTSYREASPFVASHAQSFYLEVPEGTHDYEFRLPDNHRTVLFRFLIPEKQLTKK